MPTPSWRKNPAVIQQLADNPQAYSFFQAVRLLERSATLLEKDTRKAAKPVARFTPPATEAIRFHTQQALSFPASEIRSIKRIERKAGNKQWHMNINFMGLTGVMSVLPYHYTEMILQRLKIKDETMRKFFDLFNHRTISLFYQAASKYHLPIEYERKKLHPPVKEDNDHYSQVLLSLIGLGTRGLANRLYTRDESLIYYSGLFTQQVRTSSGLKQLLEHHFDIPVEIKEFVGQWQDLIDDVRTRLPGRNNPLGQNNCLGRSVMLGKSGWFAQGKIRIILGPLNRQQLHAFAPGTRALKALDELIRIYIGMEYDYDFIIRVKRVDIPDKIRLGARPKTVLGWNTWLSSKPHRFDKDETVDISVSAGRIR